MFKQTCVLLVSLLAVTVAARAADPALVVPAVNPAAKALVYVIPVKEEINTPALYVLRRGLKDAIERNAAMVILDMNTPGGRADVMLEMMEALDKFPNKKLTYVNREAISAGAMLAAVTDEIYFAPKGIMGAAEVVQGSGENLPDSMKRKIDSYLSAKIESYMQKDQRRADVIKAMRISDFEFKLDDKLIKAKGELLTITADKAIALYGEPPTPLLASGITADLDSLLSLHYPNLGYEKIELEVTWSEELAQHLTRFSPIFLGLGLLALFVEFKTPGFGIFGVSGIILLAIVFLGNYVAGFSGHEPLLLFAVGLILVAVELIFFPGVAIVALGGLLLMLGSLVWAMADLWPGVPVNVAWSGDVFVTPLQNLGMGLALALLLGIGLMRYMPKGWVWDKMVVGSAIGGAAQVAGLGPDGAAQVASLIGQRGVAVTMLRPSGQVEVAGRRFEAKTEIGGIDTGETVIVRGRTDFGLIVEKTNS